jgi:hypothetical protein
MGRKTMILTREEFEDCVSSTSNYKRQLILDHDIELRARLEAVEASGVKAELEWDVERNDLKQQLAAVTRERDTWAELAGSFTASQHQYLRDMEALKVTLAAAEGRVKVLEQAQYKEQPEWNNPDGKYRGLTWKEYADTLTTRLAQWQEAYNSLLTRCLNAEDEAAKYRSLCK